MQPGGGGGGGCGTGRVGPVGRASSTSSAAASPSSSSSAVSTPQVGFDPQHQQQQFGSRQGFHNQLLRKFEGNENLLAYQPGGFQAVVGGSSFAPSPGSMQMPQFPRKATELSQQSSSFTHESQNRGQAGDKQAPSSVHHAYMQFAAAQQKSSALLQSQQQQKLGSVMDQDLRVGNMKMPEIISDQTASFFPNSLSINSAEQFAREKQGDQGQQQIPDRRTLKKSLNQTIPCTQSVPSNAVRPALQNQVSRNAHNMANNQLAMAQAMKAWALERNIDLSLPANASLMAQFVPFMQSRMGMQQKPIESGPVASFSASGPSKQLTNSLTAPENLQHANLLGNGTGKPWQGMAPCSLNSSSTSVTGNPSVSMQQPSFNDRESPVPSKPSIGIGNGVLSIHPSQVAAGANQSSYQNVPPKVMANCQEAPSTTQMKQFIMSPPQSTASSSDANQSSSQILQPNVGFTKQQLHVLKAQILAFRRLKKGECTLPQELLRSIAPPPLEFPLHPQLPTGGIALIDKSPMDQRNFDHKEKFVQSLPSSNGPAILKQDLYTGDEKPAIPLPSINHLHAIPKDSPLVNTSIIEMRKGEIANTGDQEAQQCTQKDASRSEYCNDKGKALASDCSPSDGFQSKKSLTSTPAQPKDSPSNRKYHGPLFDFPYFTRKHDSIGSSGMVNANNNLTLAYDIKDILCEEGSEVLNKKRQDNLKKINFLLAVNLERKRIRPDLLLKLEIEGKKLRLIDLQSRLRNEVDQQQQEIMAMPDRPYRKFVRLCERQRTELLRQVQATQKAAREKQWKMIFQWRKKLLETHWAMRDARTARNRGVAKYHERILREFSKRKDDDRDKRMEALKNNDVERYREMLMEQQTSITGDAAERYAVLSSFLTQTEEYLQKLGSKITATKNQQDVEEAANAAAAAARLQGLSEEEVKAAASCAREEVMIRNRFMEMNAPKDGSSVSKYYALAHAVSERVTRQPSMLRAGTLRDYQLVGLQWMLSLYNNKLNGILADEMGLGKTVQVMSLIAYLMEFKGNYGPHLIIVPNAVLVNWKSEFLNWLPSVSCIFYVGGKDQRAKLFSQDVSAMKFNVLVTTYEFIMFDRSKLSKVDWKYIIIDEAQRMKDRDSVLARDLDRYRCQRRLLLTGTPLQNDLKELWSLLNLLLPDVFDNRKAFHDWFSKPFLKEGPSHDADDDWLETEKKVIIIHRLHQILEPFMLRRRVEDVEGSLPPKVSIVLRCRMSAFQSAIYDWIKSTGTIRVDPDEEMTKLDRNPMYQTKVFKPLNNRCMELRKVCNHPLLNYPYFGDLSKDFLVRSCGKLWILDRVLIKLQRTGHRVLLFSTMTKLLDILEEYLQWRRLVYRRIDGTTSLEDRESAIVDFNSRGSDCFIFLLSIRAAGRGLNLQSADTVIIYDPDPNPKNEEQAVARAHRIGQTREVKVIYMEAVVDKISSHHKEDEIRSGGSVDLEYDLAGKDRYIGSIESLIRNNIQQYKIDMADEVINAGRFDQRTTHEERRMTLETLLHDEERYQETVHDVPSLQQVNRMISRSQEEVELFDQMDEELDWIEEMTSFDQVPKWLRTSTKELNSIVASLSKKPSKKLLFANGVDASVNDVRRARPKGKKRPNYKETDEENVDYSEEDDSSGMEEDAEIREFEEDRSSGGVGANKEQSDDGPLCDSTYENKQASQMNRGKHDIEEGGSSGFSSGNVVKSRLMSPVSPKKFGSLSALDARPGSVSKKDELEEGEIAIFGDSHTEHQQSESWVLDREEGEEEQVVQPKIRRKRSIRLRPRLITEKLEEGSEISPPVFPQNRLKVNSEPKSLKEQVSFKQENDPSKLRRSFPLNKALSSPKSSRMNQPNEELFDHSRETWDSKPSAGTSTPSHKMSEAIQRRCKNMVGKFQRKIAKEGQQIVPLLATLWKKMETQGLKGVNNVLDLRKMEQKVDKFEYSDVMELIYDVQMMLKNSMQYYGFSHEVRSEAKKVHDLFFDILKITFPHTDLGEERNALAFSGVNSSSTSTTPKATAAAQSKKPKVKDVDSDNSNQKAIPRSSSHSNHEVDEVPTHPGELVICKKKRKDRDKSSVKGMMSPSSSGPLSRVSQLGGSNQQVWGNCGGASVGWANPVKKLRTDSGKRRPHL